MTEPAAPAVATTFPPASLDRRFYAFTLDRLIAWTLYLLVGWFAWSAFLDDDRVVPGLAVLAGAVVVVGLGFAVVLGLTGLSPGKALLGLRAVHHGTGTPIGVGRAAVRAVILGLAGLPTFGIGLATLAWTAMTDPGRQRRGWHDHVARSVVVDIRPVPADEVAEDDGPPHIVNLTAMRLVPSAPPPEPVAGPRPRLETPPVRTAPAPAVSAAPPTSAAAARRRSTRRPTPAAPSGEPRRPPAACAGGWPSTRATPSWSRDSAWSAVARSRGPASRSGTSSRSRPRTCRCPRPTPSSTSRPTACSW